MSDALTAVSALAGAVTGTGVDSWIRMLRPASFRGVPFHFDSIRHGHGFRRANHQYPGRNTPWSEPLGHGQRTWSITGYVIGDTYPLQRAALLRACQNQAEPGALVLPIEGSVQADCTTCDFQDERETTRYSPITLEFVEHGEQRYPTGREDTTAQLGTAAGNLGDAERTSFLTNFSVSA
ncbi:MAG: DNA circularization N-terminal domain-containing protein [Alphaproteobacteria bacterium]|nr:DNA circularization N-terminal domain-containing protein [Alphaproteobacteria bacterium]